MSKFDQAMSSCKKQMENCNISCEDNLLTAIGKGLGPSLYNRDARTVAASQKHELETIKNNFLIGKLGMADGPHLDAAISRAVTKIGHSNRYKLRPVFYYLLVKDLGKESTFV